MSSNFLLPGPQVIAFLLIPSVCYVVSPGPMRLKRRPLVRDVFFYVAMVSVLLTTLGSGVRAGSLGRERDVSSSGRINTSWDALRSE